MSIGALQESNAPVILMLVSPFAGDRCFLGIKVENGESEMTLRRSSLFSYSPSHGECDNFGDDSNCADNVVGFEGCEGLDFSSFGDDRMDTLSTDNYDSPFAILLTTSQTSPCRAQPALPSAHVAGLSAALAHVIYPDRLLLSILYWFVAASILIISFGRFSGERWFFIASVLIFKISFARFSGECVVVFISLYISLSSLSLSVRFCSCYEDNFEKGFPSQTNQGSSKKKYEGMITLLEQLVDFLSPFVQELWLEEQSLLIALLNPPTIFLKATHNSDRSSSHNSCTEGLKKLTIASTVLQCCWAVFPVRKRLGKTLQSSPILDEILLGDLNLTLPPCILGFKLLTSLELSGPFNLGHSAVMGCGGSALRRLKLVGIFLEEEDVIERILSHCNHLESLWTEDCSCYGSSGVGLRIHHQRLSRLCLHGPVGYQVMLDINAPNLEVLDLWLPCYCKALGLSIRVHQVPKLKALAIGVCGFRVCEAPFYDLKSAFQTISANASSHHFHLEGNIYQVRYAFELLTNPIWKRDYDLFALDEHLSVLNDITKQYSGENYSKINLPLLDATSSGGKDLAFNVLTPEEFGSVLGGSKPLLIQVYSNGSYCCASFINNWKRIAGLLDGVADTGMVELGNIKLTTFFAERYSLKHPIFRNDRLNFLQCYDPVISFHSKP
ncbi:hypothetical protein AXF42_Ash016479 [Apostasia shenzhenica]|uniref:F-box/LRR-repeat protein 15/At3g58940/PEG3-like LRR domain-containing protein n=1 Tax=Apostasia shenzhenica TaxID=1088818 RepID=A0A2I0AV76_9ASPA|nr:hypothetical protein AXF42_Ash016479 [Apostasia shenzhenica]